MSAKRSVLVFLVLIGFAALTITVSAGSDRGKKWKKILEGAKITLVDAIEKAEQKTGGKAIEAEMELEGGKVIIDVIVLKGGDSPKLVEVEVNGVTGVIQEIEEEGSEDEDDEDDDDDDEDDDEHDDDDDDHDDDDEEDDDDE